MTDFWQNDPIVSGGRPPPGMFDDLIPDKARGLFDDVADLDPAGGEGQLKITVRPPIPPEGRAVLDAIAGSESLGYSTIYGGSQFNDFSDHPRQLVPITKGPNAGKKSSAAGRYQFLQDTWDETASELGLIDFTPASQDTAAWHLAQKTYRIKTGRELTDDIRRSGGKPSALNGIGRYLAKTWTSLPGGIEPNKATGGFGSRLNTAYAPETSAAASDSWWSKDPIVSTAKAGMFDDVIPSKAGGLFDDVPDAVPSPPPNGIFKTPNLVPGHDGASAPGAAPAAQAHSAGGQFASPTMQNFRTAREGVSPPVATASDAVKGDFLRGVTFNFIDELNGLAAAGGLDPNDRDVANALAALAKGAWRKYQGDPDADAAYRARTSLDRETAERTKEQQPAASIAGEVAGAVMLPGGALLRAATLPGRIARGSAVGAGYGAAAGAGGGTNAEDRIERAKTGGMIGAGVGAAAPPLLGGIEAAGRGVATLARPVTSAIRGAVNPDAEAGRRVVTALERDMRLGRAGLSPQEFAVATREGAPVAIADMGGETTRALARSAANTSPEGRAVLQDLANSRFEGQAERATTFIRNLVGGNVDTQASRDALKASAQNVNNPAYARAYNAPNAQSMWDEGFEQLMQAPLLQEAAKGATRTGAKRCCR